MTCRQPLIPCARAGSLQLACVGALADPRRSAPKRVQQTVEIVPGVELGHGDQKVAAPLGPESAEVDPGDHAAAARALEHCADIVRAPDDELVEVTPEAIRVRKRLLTESQRRQAKKRN